jgi:signal transduction histidine kinase
LHQPRDNVTNVCIHDDLPMSRLAPRSDDSFRRYESLRAALDLIDQGLTLIDSDLRFVAWNKTFLRLLDFPSEMGYVGAPFESFMRYNAERGEYGSGDPQGYIDERMRAARAFEAHEIERTRPDGTVLHVRGVPVPGHGFVTLYSDITAQRQAERQISEHTALLESRVTERTGELRRSDAQLRLIIDSMPALIAYFGRDRVYRYINRGYRDWFGLDPANPGAASARAFLGAGTYAGIRPHVLRALAGEAATFEYEIGIVGGRSVIARTTLVPEIAADGAVTGCFEMTFDITEQRRAQEMLVQAQKLDALGQLTGGLAHDFNNILTVILGNLGALTDARGGDATVAGFVEPAVEAARRGAELIKALLSFSRKQPLAAKAADVAPLLASVGRMVRRSLPDGVQLDIGAGEGEGAGVDAAPLCAWIDADQLQNALLNLILNARDATPAAGRIGVHASAQVLDAARAAAWQIAPGRYVRIAVSDNGSGMDAPTLARMFEPFFTTKRPGLGTGLGMAMVYGFVKQSGGAIDIASQVGQGTTVALWLPVCDTSGAPPLPALPAITAPGTVRSDARLALLVEDEPEVRKVVRRWLVELGFAVIEAENGREAMQILDQMPGFALLLSDVVMPGDIDGRALAAHARAHCGVPRVVLMSGYAPDGAQSATAPDGATIATTATAPMLAKPFTKPQLAHLLESLPT